MNRNKKQMKFEATCLTEAQRCEIIAKLSKPNAMQVGVGAKYEVSKGAIRKVMEMMQIEEEPPVDDKI